MERAKDLSLQELGLTKKTFVLRKTDVVLTKDPNRPCERHPCDKIDTEGSWSKAAWGPC